MSESLEQQRDQLLAENAELRALNQKVAQLVNHLAHELRTPLTSITGFSEFLLRNAERQSPEKLRYYCEILFLESSRLSRMVDNLLDLSRMRSGKMSLDLAPAAFGSVVGHSLQSLQLQAAEKKITLGSSLDPRLPLLLLDSDKMQQVLTNLLANAIHYSPRDSQVEVGARLQDGELLCWVRDNGIGIAPQDQARIFDEFYRVEGDAAQLAKGTGLGLPITKAIVEMHGGRIWVESVLGHGSTFFVAVPFREA